MREIKFRAWDGYRMNYAFWVGSLNGLAGAVTGSEPITIEQRSGWAVMQFTGLLDAKGKEIYEGDILKAKDETVWRVNFEYGSFGAQCVSTRFKGASDWHSFATISFDNLAAKIIGNIYEHPHLLTP